MRRSLYIALASTMVIFGFTGVSLAGHNYHGCTEMHMSNLSEMDTDSDGFISLDEFSERPMQKYRGWFKALDTNDDGSLSQEEWEAFRREHGHGHGEGSEG